MCLAHCACASLPPRGGLPEWHKPSTAACCPHFCYWCCCHCPTAPPLATLPQDYKPPSHLIDTIHLTFLLNEESTRVESRMRVLPNPAAAANGAADSLFLDGREGACCLPGLGWLWVLTRHLVQGRLLMEFWAVDWRVGMLCTLRAVAFPSQRLPCRLFLLLCLPLPACRCEAGGCQGEWGGAVG